MGRMTNPTANPTKWPAAHRSGLVSTKDCAAKNDRSTRSSSSLALYWLFRHRLTSDAAPFVSRCSDSRVDR
jgi:hypothetical protein